MYTNPSSAEQCLHNALRVVSAMQSIGIEYDIQATDITDPNPITLMLLIVQLYQQLPHYLPRNTVEFIGSPHTSIFRQVYAYINYTFNETIYIYVLIKIQNKSNSYITISLDVISIVNII